MLAGSHHFSHHAFYPPLQAELVRAYRAHYAWIGRLVAPLQTRHVCVSDAEPDPVLIPRNSTVHGAKSYDYKARPARQQAFYPESTNELDLERFNAANVYHEAKCKHYFGSLGAPAGSSRESAYRNVATTSQDWASWTGNFNGSAEGDIECASKGNLPGGDAYHDVVIGTRHGGENNSGFIYVDVPKAGSEMIRGSLAREGSSWLCSAASNKGRMASVEFVRACGTRGRTTLAHLTTADSGAFRWAAVRDPTTRFCSSFREAVFHGACGRLKWPDGSIGKNVSLPFNNRLKRGEGTGEELQECFEKYVSGLQKGQTVDHHAASQAHFLLAPCVRNPGAHAPFTFIGKLEEVDDWWPLLSNSLFGKASLPKTVRAHKSSAVRLNISVEVRHVRAFCDLYAQDYACFGYTLPPACQQP